MQLSKHFKLEEMTKSMTATRKNIDNSPGAGDIKNLENVCFEIAGVPNIQTAYWIQNNCDFDQLILEFYKKDDPAGGWVHVSYNEKGANRKQVLTYDGKSYENGLPEMKWSGGKVVG
jgi:hypothetical protein